MGTEGGAHRYNTVHDRRGNTCRNHTTPEALEFQDFFRDAHADCSYVVTEVSSHALAQKRVDGTVFKGAVFTNLTRDHLDFHKTMEDYFAAKTRLFTELLDEGGRSIINYDDPWGRRLQPISKERAGMFGPTESRKARTYGRRDQYII